MVVRALGERAARARPRGGKQQHLHFPDTAAGRPQPRARCRRGWARRGPRGIFLGARIRHMRGKDVAFIDARSRTSTAPRATAHCSGRKAQQLGTLRTSCGAGESDILSISKRSERPLKPPGARFDEARSKSKRWVGNADKTTIVMPGRSLRAEVLCSAMAVVVQRWTVGEKRQEVEEDSSESRLPSEVRCRDETRSGVVRRCVVVVRSQGKNDKNARKW